MKCSDARLRADLCGSAMGCLTACQGEVPPTATLRRKMKRWHLTAEPLECAKAACRKEKSLLKAL